MTSCNLLSDAFVLKLDLNGDFIWAKQTCGTDKVEVTSLAASLNDVYLLGTFDSTTDFDPGSTSYYLNASYLRRDLFFLKWGLLTGIEETQIINGVSVYPNPSNGKVRVNSSSGLLSKLEVFDVMGKLVLVQPTKSFSEETDLSHFANGLYLLRAWVGGTYNTFKILKE